MGPSSQVNALALNSPPRGASRELHQRPTRPTLAEEHEVTQKVKAIYISGVLRPTRDLSVQGQVLTCDQG